MTGFGNAQLKGHELTVRVEIRSVNNRHLKLTCRLPEGYAALEPRLEVLVRQHVRRGAIQLNLQVERDLTAQDYRINESVLTAYYLQLTRISQRLSADGEVSLESLLTLPARCRKTCHHNWISKRSGP